MSRIDSRNWKISSSRHFQNDHHNIAKIQHWPILWWPFWKWHPVEIVQCRESIQDIIIYPPINFQCRESIQDIIIYPHIKFWWYQTMLNFNGIVMATGRIFSMSGINRVDYDVPNWFLTSKNFYRSPFSKWPPQYRKNSSSEFVTMQSVHLNMLSVAGLGDLIIIRFQVSWNSVQ
jgi:hypothetical protein